MSELEARIRSVVETVVDPCSRAYGVPLGLGDMGLIGQLEIRPVSGGRVDVDVQLRLTSPGCMYGPFFESTLRERVAALSEVACVRVTFAADEWTPHLMTSRARARLERSRRLTLAHRNDL